MNKLFSIAIIALIAASVGLSLNSCKNKDQNPLGTYTCTCFRVHTIDSAHIVLDTPTFRQDLVDKTTAQNFCSGTQAAMTDTFGSVAHCSLNQ
jgi:hypothetical protein